jgi:hypothetical protein
MHNVVPDYGKNTEKTCKLRHKHSLTWNMERNTKKVGKCEMHTVGYGIW